MSRESEFERLQRELYSLPHVKNFKDYIIERLTNPIFIKEGGEIEIDCNDFKEKNKKLSSEKIIKKKEIYDYFLDTFTEIIILRDNRKKNKRTGTLEYKSMNVQIAILHHGIKILEKCFPELISKSNTESNENNNNDRIEELQECVDNLISKLASLNFNELKNIEEEITDVFKTIPDSDIEDSFPNHRSKKLSYGIIDRLALMLSLKRQEKSSNNDFFLEREADILQDAIVPFFTTPITKQEEDYIKRLSYVEPIIDGATKIDEKDFYKRYPEADSLMSYFNLKAYTSYWTYKNLINKINEKIERREKYHKNQKTEIENLEFLKQKLTDYVTPITPSLGMVFVVDMLSSDIKSRRFMGGKRKKSKKRRSNKKRRKTRRY